jgi:hypothetical protein
MSDITTDFITATKKILSKVATILTHIEVVEGDVKLIREQVVANADKPRTETQAQHSQEKNPGSVPASDPDQTERQKQKGKEETGNSFYRFLNRWWEELRKPKFQVAVLTLVGLVAYTCETRRTNNLAEKTAAFQFSMTRSQQRAYMAITPSPKAIKLEDFTAQHLTVELKNVGRSAASKILYEFVLEFPKALEQPSFDYGKIHTIGTVGPLFPESDPTPVEVYTFDNQSHILLMTDELREELKSGKRYLAIFGIVKYEDIFGEWWTQMCGWKPFPQLAAGESKQFNAPTCVAYNVEGGTPKAQTQ